jgi:hypothetical protein
MFRTLLSRSFTKSADSIPGGELSCSVLLCKILSMYLASFQEGLVREEAVGIDWRERPPLSKHLLLHWCTTFQTSANVEVTTVHRTS